MTKKETYIDYYKKIKNVIENKEINEGVRRLQFNKDTLNAYYEIVKLLIEARGGENKTKYGDMLIKKWSIKLMEQYGKGYSTTNLKKMKQFYIIQKVHR